MEHASDSRFNIVFKPKSNPIYETEVLADDVRGAETKAWNEILRMWPRAHDEFEITKIEKLTYGGAEK